MRSEVRRDALIEFRELPVAQSAEDIVPCPDGTRPLTFLNPPTAGFFCPFCSSFKTVRWKSLGSHLLATHGKSIKGIDKDAVSCHLQKWTTRPGPGSGKWWRVSSAAIPSGCHYSTPTDVGADSENESEAEERTLSRMEAEEEKRLRLESEQNVAYDKDLEIDENSAWL
jgi:hypothetical protein